MDDAIASMIKEGGGYLMAAIFLMLYLYERKTAVAANVERIAEIRATMDASNKAAMVLEKVPEAIALLANEFRVEIRNVNQQIQQLQNTSRGR